LVNVLISFVYNTFEFFHHMSNGGFNEHVLDHALQVGLAGLLLWMVCDLFFELFIQLVDWWRSL
jgi:hypothetical protein